jgi:hypothetical protein
MIRFEFIRKLEISFWNIWISTIEIFQHVLAIASIEKIRHRNTSIKQYPGKTIAIGTAGLSLGVLAGYLFILTILR